ncbi:MAG: sigma-54-dependent Fis family transcriptional regulator [Deltaproteobacteria bacterium]|nr:sigma-54-dependent Fis family transcriptional regulator [Deltaproteobacteria bacterium]
MVEVPHKPANGICVFVVDDDRPIRVLLTKWLELEGYTVMSYEDGSPVLDAIAEHSPSAICLDVMMPHMDGLETLRRMREAKIQIPVIMLSAKDLVETAVNAMRLGAFDYQLKPVDRERLITNLKNAVRQYELLKRVQTLEQEVRAQNAFSAIVGSAPKMKALFQQMQRLLDSTIPVFITGESGTGKELVARAIHYDGTRKDGPFVELNCAAISESLLESELFGHEKGAFTGAVAAHKGKFEQAHGGTLFLDEIGEISPTVQARLLRVLQEGRLTRLGGQQTISVDVRIISATNRNIEAMVKAGQFREDLYYRLVVYTLSLPPLRHRSEDLADLCAHFIRKHSPQVGRTVTGLSAGALEMLMRYDWPGNVRELENIMRRALISSEGELIGVEALPEKLQGLPAPAGSRASAVPPSITPAVVEEEIVPLSLVERQTIERALAVCDGNITVAAKRLGIGRTTLYRKMIAYKLSTQEAAGLSEAQTDDADAQQKTRVD